jgi:asparagine synthetase B (glutamine-hydrolysing)
MPGIAGCIRLTATSAVPDQFQLQLEGPLSREPDYVTRPVIASPDASAIVFSPQLSFPVAGTAHDKESGISAGYFGEFFGPDFQSAESCAIARKLIELYQINGEALPQSLDGTFVAFLWDSRVRRGILFNDHYASRPVCYGEQKGFFYFSPEPKGIAGLPGFQVTTDESALVMVLTHGHLLGGTTYYQQIKYLDPGSIVCIDRGGVRISKHFEYLPNEQPVGDTTPELIENLGHAIRAACRRRVHHAPHMVVPISGGFDSRGLLAVFQGLTDCRLKTVSWGTNEDTPHADACTGRQLANFFHTEHRFLPRDFGNSVDDVEELIARIDGGSVDAVQHPSELRLMRFIRNELGTDYLIRGDEVFGFKGAAASDAEAFARCGLRELSEFPDVVRLLNPARRAGFLEQSHAALEKVRAECPLLQPSARKDYFHYYQKIRNFANRSNYYKLSVLEAANPWLDKKVVEFLQTIPAPCRVEKMLYRRTLETLFPDLMKIPIATRNSVEDWAVVMKEYVPLQKLIRFHLLEQRNRFHDMMDMDAVAAVVTATFQGQRTESAKVRIYARAKGLLRVVSPKIYDMVRSKAQGRLIVASIPVDYILLRFLLIKLWCDRIQ